MSMPSIATRDIKKNASAKLVALVKSKCQELEDHTLLALHGPQRGPLGSGIREKLSPTGNTDSKLKL